MSEPRLTYVYCYDIDNDRVRGRFARFIERHAVRVQKSVFEARLTEAEANRLFEALSRRIDLGDALRMYCLAPAALAKCRSTGGTPLPEEGEFWIV
tara:strand:- start:792 stop:1079 length:288 start_codon:yes stop_codon:yes gene_type:complete